MQWWRRPRIHGRLDRGWRRTANLDRAPPEASRTAKWRNLDDSGPSNAGGAVGRRPDARSAVHRGGLQRCRAGRNSRGRRLGSGRMRVPAGGREANVRHFGRTPRTVLDRHPHHEPVPGNASRALAMFHERRRADVEAGMRPTVQDSLRRASTPVIGRRGAGTPGTRVRAFGPPSLRPMRLAARRSVGAEGPANGCTNPDTYRIRFDCAPGN